MAEQPVKVTAEQLGIDEGEEHDAHLEFDLGNMMAYDATAVDATTFRGGVDQACHGLATTIFQALTRQLFNLPSEPATVGRIAELPPPTTALPREKPVPKPRPPTKWEVFAQRKGITKHKRSKLEYDETAGDWKRRHGYKKANDAEAVPIIDAAPGEDTGVEDPFTRLRREKKERVGKQQGRQLSNLKAADKAGGKGALPATLKLAATLPEHGRGKPSKRKELKGELKTATRQVATSTASLGKFDKVVKGEDLKDRQAGNPKARKRTSVTGFKEERAAQGKLVDHIIRKNADDIVDIGRAIGKFETTAQDGKKEYRMKMKGANKKGRLTGGKKGAPNGGKKGPPGKGPPGGGKGAAGGVRKGGKGGKR